MQSSSKKSSRKQKASKVKASEAPIQASPNFQALRIGVVRSRFNSEITEKLETGALNYLKGLDEEFEITLVQVPGAVEIPLACQALFRAGCQAVVAVGAVIRGDTSHYDLVCNSVERGVTQLMLDWGRPIGFGVITTENEDQAFARAGGEHGNKGTEAAQVAIEMLGLLANIQADAAASVPAIKKSKKAKRN